MYKESDIVLNLKPLSKENLGIGRKEQLTNYGSGKGGGSFLIRVYWTWKISAFPNILKSKYWYGIQKIIVIAKFFSSIILFSIGYNGELI